MFNSESQVSYFTTLLGNLKGNKSYRIIKKEYIREGCILLGIW